jgi:hypothetical protein
MTDFINLTVFIKKDNINELASIMRAAAHQPFKRFKFYLFIYCSRATRLQEIEHAGILADRYTGRYHYVRGH